LRSLHLQLASNLPSLFSSYSVSMAELGDYIEQVTHCQLVYVVFGIEHVFHKLIYSGRDNPT
jgi:hypothetical protein